MATREVMANPAGPNPLRSPRAYGPAPRFAAPGNMVDSQPWNAGCIGEVAPKVTPRPLEGAGLCLFEAPAGSSRAPDRGRSPPYLRRSLRRSTQSVLALAGSVAGANCPDPPNGTQRAGAATDTEQAVRMTRLAIA
jgi:hypothetical protein